MSTSEDPTPTGQMPPVGSPQPRRGFTFTLRPVYVVVALVVVAVGLGAFFGVRALSSGNGTPRYASTYPKNMTQLLSQGMPTATGAQVLCVANWLENNVSYGDLQSQGSVGLAAYTTELHQA